MLSGLQHMKNRVVVVVFLFYIKKIVKFIYFFNYVLFTKQVPPDTFHHFVSLTFLISRISITLQGREVKKTKYI